MKNKFILITLIFFIILSFLLPSYSLANFEFDFYDIHYSIPDFNHFEHFFMWYTTADGSTIDIWSFDDISHLKFKELSADDRYPHRYNLDLGSHKVNCYWYRFYAKTGELYCFYDNSYISPSTGSMGSILYSTFDIKDENGLILFNKAKQNATIENKEQIQTGKFDKVIINAADYTDKEFYLLTYYYSENTDNPFDVMLPRKIIDLKIHNSFYVGTKNEKAIYEVPLSHTGIELKER